MRLSWRNFTSGLWFKGPREHNPAGTLRRAKSVYPLRTGSIRSRSPITTIAALDAHSLFKYGGTRIAGVSTAIYREVVGVFTAISGTFAGTATTFVAAPPTVGKDDVIFLAGNPLSSKLQKLNSALDTASQWGLDRPSDTKPDAAQGTLLTKDIDLFDATTDWSASVVDEADTDISDSDFPKLELSAAKRVEGAGSLRFRAKKDATTRIDKLIVKDLSNFSMAGDSGDEDYIELYVAFNRPKHVKNMEITFYVGSGAPTFDDETDTYSRELTFAVVKKKRKKKLVGTGDLIRKKDVEEALRTGRLDKVDFSMAEFVAEDKIGVTRRTWTRLTIPKASFTANGNAGTTGKTFANVQAVRISVECTKQGGSRVWLDRMRMIGGAGMQGDYQYMFTFLNNNTGTRSNPSPKTTDTNGDEIYDPVIIRNIERNGVVLGGVTVLPAPTDPQVTHIEIWRTVGNGTLFFLADKVVSTSAAPATTYTDRVADYPGMFSGGTGTKFLQPEELPDDNDRPDDTVADAVGPFDGRVWLTRATTSGAKNRVFYSPVGRMEAVENYIPIGSNDEECQKLVIWNGELYAFTKRALYRLIGSDATFVFQPVLGVPGTPFPGTVQATDGGIVYQARDGFRVYDGTQSMLVADDALAPIGRGGSSDGISAFSGVASVWGRDEYMVSDTNTTLAFSPSSGWRNVGVPCKAFVWEPDTRILLASATISATTRIVSFEGDASGETGGAVAETTNDVGGTGLASDFEVETPGDYKGAGVWGIAQRIYIEGQTEGQVLTVSLIIDNTAVSLGTVSTTAGVKKVMEVAVQRAGYITGVRLSAAAGTLTKRIEISAVELDVYVSAAA
jgi:hypothetical protein